MHGEREGVYIEGVECACIGRGSVHAWGKEVCVHGARECACMGQGSVGA